MDISVVIPTCNRPARLRSLLDNLSHSTQRVREVLVVDSSDETLAPGDLPAFPELRVDYLEAPRSVCVQRNIGIRKASAPWIFLCDDDIEVPSDYLALLVAHAGAHPACGAVSGVVLEPKNGGWVGQFPEMSSLALLWKYLFGLGVWGEIRCHDALARVIADRYRTLGNHISRAGWPIITEMEGAFFRTPVYALGASLVKRDWLLASPYDEILDSHGIGDNYGVAIGFPPEGIHVVNGAHVYHHRAQENRLAAEIAQEKRLLALDYFLRSPKHLTDVSRAAFLWSLVGVAILHGLSGQGTISRTTWRTLLRLLLGRNPYLAGRGGAAS